MDIIKYRPETIYLYDDGKLKKRNMYSNFYGENKFKNSGWFDFFDQYIYPSVSDKITLNSPVNQIDYSGDQVIVTNENGDEFTGDRVIVTVPIKILQNQSINFIPAFDSGRQEAIDKVDMPDGLKVLIEFSEKFYPDILNMGSLVDFSDDSSGERIYYNAAFRKDTIHHVFALFSVGEASSQYTSLGSDDAIIEKVMAELDEIFDGKATQTYIQHRVQNWSAEPYIQGSYSHYGNDYSSIIETISSSINGKIFFAGEAMTSENWSTVHGAGETSFAVVEEILKNA
jgi:monoamine oxidase